MARLAASSNVNSNPYCTFRLCCTRVRTKEHSQLIGIVSLAVFICLVVVSYSLFGVFSVAYIAIGLLVYGFFIESLLRKPNKFALLGYITFESLQIAFYLSLAIYITIPLIYANSDNWTCPKHAKSTSPTTTEEPCPSWAETRSALIEVLVFVCFLIVLKAYFTRVILFLYKYYNWIEEHASDMRAQYVNGRGVQINVDDNIFPTPFTSSQGLAYVQPVPTYDEATTMSKPVPVYLPSPPAFDAEPRTAVQQQREENP
ncbi:hypothetical protein M3Y94_00545300 [Aphelenchoides besseyi]|nr:hypothetical protein M3Y94_00545300 [Aphelenchoides besseyi]KAI6225749.1 hypothetical protein M3Y95_00729900 [Aphelenchoides besseyi]